MPDTLYYLALVIDRDIHTIRMDGSRGAKEVCAGVDLLAGGYDAPQEAESQRNLTLARLAKEYPGAWFFIYCSEYRGDGVVTLRVVRLTQRRFTEIQQREHLAMPWPPPLAWDEMQSHRRQVMDRMKD